uniref:Fucosyltransferase n=1 Tax=Rhinopithecus bieti TaxID=61621 RepID=A0A2K6MTV9_RHIBE
MDPLGPIKPQWSWRRCLAGLLFQLLVAVCFFSYLRVSRDDATGSPSGSSRQDTTPTRPPLLILLWTWPFPTPPWLMSRCSGDGACTAELPYYCRPQVYPQAGSAVIRAPPGNVNWYNPSCPSSHGSPRRQGQRWIWFSMESPSHCWHLQALDDTSISPLVGLGRGGPRGAKPHQAVNLNHGPTAAAWDHVETLCPGNKFYLASRTSLATPDYITEKLWRNARWRPGREQYERFLPPDRLHPTWTTSQRAGQGHAPYLSYFRWRETLRPRFSSWALDFCKACWKLQEESRYQTVRSIAAWFT